MGCSECNSGYILDKNINQCVEIMDFNCKEFMEDDIYSCKECKEGFSRLSQMSETTNKK